MARQLSTDPGKKPCKVLKVGSKEFVYRKDFVGSLSREQRDQYCDSEATTTLSEAKGQRVVQSREKLSMLGSISKKCLPATVSLEAFPKCVEDAAGDLKRGKSKVLTENEKEMEE